MKLLNDYMDLQKNIYDYFGYIEDWRVFPITVDTDCYWSIIGTEDNGSVRFSDCLDKLKNSDGDYYENEIYRNRHLPKWVYRGEEYTMIVVDTHTDGNKFLQIFENAKEINL